MYYQIPPHNKYVKQQFISVALSPPQQFDLHQSPPRLRLHQPMEIKPPASKVQTDKHVVFFFLIIIFILALHRTENKAVMETAPKQQLVQC